MALKTETEKHLSDGKGGGGVGGRGAKSYDDKKAWSSINHSIRPGTGCLHVSTDLQSIHIYSGEWDR